MDRLCGFRRHHHAGLLRKALPCGAGGTDEQRQDNQDLSDLLFERDSVQQFKLDHGYPFANPQMGCAFVF